MCFGFCHYLTWRVYVHLLILICKPGQPTCTLTSLIFRHSIVFLGWFTVLKLTDTSTFNTRTRDMVMSPPCLLFAIKFLLCAFNAFNTFWSLLDHAVFRRVTLPISLVPSAIAIIISAHHFSFPHYLSLQTPIVQAMADTPGRQFSGTVTELKRYLCRNKLPITGKKEALKLRCEKHSLHCRCTFQE